MQESVKELFEAAAAKYLSHVDAYHDGVSKQHEIGGLVRAGLGPALGDVSGKENQSYSTIYAYLPGDESGEEPPTIIQSSTIWYDARRDKPRGSEYRLYYHDNDVTSKMTAGDLLVVAKFKGGGIAFIVTPQGSPAEAQLRYLFGLPALNERMKAAKMPDHSILLPIRLLLEEIGINPFRDEDVNNDLEMLLEHFPKGLPKTEILSGMARDLTGIDSRDDPDGALLAWLDREELLFRAYEKHLVADRLRKGFGEDGADVDEFVSFSLSVHNRRKSRVGYAFENHLTTVFEQHGLQFERGKGKLYTEGKQQPDWMFPNFAAYHDPLFPTDKLTLLGAKTTCKDRWRQVLAEGDRLERKYLATLEAGISERQTQQMQEKNLQLIVPRAVHGTYMPSQSEWLYTLSDFVNEVRSNMDLS